MVIDAFRQLGQRDDRVPVPQIFQVFGEDRRWRFPQIMTPFLARAETVIG
jgi:hypothetical protein